MAAFLSPSKSSSCMFSDRNVCLTLCNHLNPLSTEIDEKAKSILWPIFLLLYPYMIAHPYGFVPSLAIGCHAGFHFYFYFFLFFFI